MTARTITIGSLVTDYAQDIAAEAGLDATDYQATAAGLAQLLTDTAADMPAGQINDWLTDAAADLNSLGRVAATDSQTRTVLARVEARLYEAHYDLV